MEITLKRQLSDFDHPLTLYAINFCIDDSGDTHVDELSIKFLM